MVRAQLHIGLTLAALSLSTACSGLDKGERGEVLFVNNCATCHSQTGEGNQLIQAPAIAGLPQWYVERQVSNFRDGKRGAHFDDVAGLRMRPMSRTLTDDKEVALVSAYVSKLKPHKGAATLEGDAAAGEAKFAVCKACHGVNGEGSELMGGPPLTGADDWYMLTQLKNFKSGIRGSAEGDKMGATMVATGIPSLATEDDMKNVIAFIRTLE